jgi:hypothetical protein
MVSTIYGAVCTPVCALVPATQLGMAERGNPVSCMGLCHLYVASSKEKNAGFYRKKSPTESYSTTLSFVLLLR